MMSLYSIRTIQVWVAMHILASISTVFAGLSVEYKWLSSNCTFLDVHVATFAPSIGMCAVLCTQTSDCNGFIWKENGCDMLKTCPRCCKSNSDIDTEWSLYCPDDVPGPKPEDCSQVQAFGGNTSGVYTMYPGGCQFNAYCDMETEGGGWTVLTARIDNTLLFAKSWTEYKAGFGDIDGNHWLGNDIIHLLTKDSPSDVYFKLRSTNGTWFYAVYSNFTVGPESDQYRLRFDPTSYRGNAGNSLYPKGYVWDYEERHMNNQRFSTYDRDNDNRDQSCSTKWADSGGWWFNDCAVAKLTSGYGSRHYTWIYSVGKLQESVMMIRRIG